MVGWRIWISSALFYIYVKLCWRNECAWSLQLLAPFKCSEYGQKSLSLNRDSNLDIFGHSCYYIIIISNAKNYENRSHSFQSALLKHDSYVLSDTDLNSVEFWRSQILDTYKLQK